MNISDLVFEYGQVSLAGRGRRGLVARERRAVLTGAGSQISYSLVQRACVGMSERERLLIVDESVAVGVQAPCVVPCQPIVSCGLIVLACQPVVAGDLAREGIRFAPAGLSFERDRGAAVKETLAGQAGLLVDQSSQLVVVEVVGRGPSDRATDLPDQTSRRQLFERRQRLFFTPAAGRPDGVEVERPSDYGGGGEHLPRRFTDRKETGPEEILHPLVASRPRPLRPTRPSRRPSDTPSERAAGPRFRH